MPAELLRSLPGVTFETVSPPLDEALPRMDVAVFVGFAASGPVNIPVAIAEPADFVNVFGADVRLAWDLARGEPAYAHLGPAVRAFFRNGGTRCWVVRAAAAPTVNTFQLPDLLTWSVNGTTALPAVAQARSGGSWSDDLEVAVVLRRDGLIPSAIRISGAALALTLPASAKVEARDLLRLTLRDYTAFGGVTAITSSSAQIDVRLGPVVWFANLSSPPGSITFVGTNPPVASIPVKTTVEVLHLDLQTRHNGLAPQRIEQLGMVNGHPRFWNTFLQTDADFFAPLADPAAVDVSADAPPRLDVRFPLAGGAQPVDLTIPARDLIAPQYRGREPLAASAAERDGLTAFDLSLFLDSRLRDASSNSLMALAESIRYLGANPPELLAGIHAACFIDEATSIAVPDAVHPAWTVADATEPSAAPTLASPSTAAPAEAPPKDPCACPPFVVCDPGGLAVPTLQTPAINDGDSITLTWSTVSDAERYTVEEADAPAFDTWYEVATTPQHTFTVYGRTPGVYQFRVRALSATQTGLASAGRMVTIASTPRAIAGDSLGLPARRALLDFHRALLNMCAARADLVAVLSLPESYRESDALDHARELTDGNAENASTYGALYHPWVIASEDAGGALRRVPPDGAACGVIARRAIARGAWVAPANEPLTGVVALTPALRDDADTRRRLLTAQLNIITREPKGFLVLNADTLSGDLALRPLNVRRLMILLRKRALQVGSLYVFEPNGPAFARLVQRGFEDMLGHLYERGAFAGPTAAASYQVIVDEALNTQQLRDRGQFIVELRVAPSWPLAFLRVRLLQHGDHLSATEAP